MGAIAALSSPLYPRGACVCGGGEVGGGQFTVHRCRGRGMHACMHCGLWALEAPPSGLHAMNIMSAVQSIISTLHHAPSVQYTIHPYSPSLVHYTSTLSTVHHTPSPSLVHYTMHPQYSTPCTLQSITSTLHQHPPHPLTTLPACLHPSHPLTTLPACRLHLCSQRV